MGLQSSRTPLETGSPTGHISHGSGTCQTFLMVFEHWDTAHPQRAGSGIVLLGPQGPEVTPQAATEGGITQSLHPSQPEESHPNPSAGK